MTEKKHIKACKHALQRIFLFVSFSRDFSPVKAGKNLSSEKALRPFQKGKRERKKMYRKLVKNIEGWKVVQFNDNGTKEIIAKIEKNRKKGYDEHIFSSAKKAWILPQYFSWYPTLKAIKNRLNCI